MSPFAAPYSGRGKPPKQFYALVAVGGGLQVLDFLREVDYGPDENQPEEQVIARIGAAAIEAWDRDAVPPPGWDVEPEDIIAEWASLLNTLSGPAIIPAGFDRYFEWNCSVCVGRRA